jgi:signal transduction histidine kinase
MMKMIIADCELNFLFLFSSMIALLVLVSAISVRVRTSIAAMIALAFSLSIAILCYLFLNLPISMLSVFVIGAVVMAVTVSISRPPGGISESAAPNTLLSDNASQSSSAPTNNEPEDSSPQNPAFQVSGQDAADIETLARERTLFMLKQSKRLRVALKEQETLNDLQRSFVTVLSHEIRTPLAIIDGSAQKLKSRAATLQPDDIIQRANMIRDAVRRLTGLVDKILSSAKYEDGKLPLRFQRIDLKDLIKDACNRIGGMAVNHRLVVDIEDLPEVLGDSEALRQLMDNLLSNAVKYAPNADHVDIRAHCSDDRIIVEIEDYGLGVDEDEVPNIFNRFFRARTSEGIEGTGIGLSTVKSIVDQHGGEIRVVSRKGEGTIFTVELPSADSIAQSADQAVA